MARRQFLRSIGNAVLELVLLMSARACAWWAYAHLAGGLGSGGGCPTSACLAQGWTSSCSER